MSAEQQAGVKRRSSRAAREGKRRRRNAARTTAPPSVQEATQAAASATSEQAQAETAAARAEARRQAKAQASKSTSRRRFVSSERTEGLRRFWRETMAEIRKVIWPDRETTRNLTLLVIALSVVLGILLGGIDWVLFQVFEAV